MIQGNIDAERERERERDELEERRLAPGLDSRVEVWQVIRER